MIYQALTERNKNKRNKIAVQFALIKHFESVKAPAFWAVLWKSTRCQRIVKLTGEQFQSDIQIAHLLEFDVKAALVKAIKILLYSG